MKRLGTLLCGMLAIIMLTGFFGPDGDTLAEKRASVQKMRKDTLTDLYAIHPAAKKRIANAVAYAVFSNVGTNLFLLSTGSGWGVAHKKSGKAVYMKMISVGIGPGLGIKDFRGVFVFTTSKAYEDFVEQGWDASGQADAAAKSDDKGGALAGAINVGPGMDLYQITKNGLALQATIQGTKYYKDDELNSKE